MQLISEVRVRGSELDVVVRTMDYCDQFRAAAWQASQVARQRGYAVEPIKLANEGQGYLAYTFARWPDSPKAAKRARQLKKLLKANKAHASGHRIISFPTTTKIDLGNAKSAKGASAHTA